MLTRRLRVLEGEIRSRVSSDDPGADDLQVPHGGGALRYDDPERWHTDQWRSGTGSNDGHQLVFPAIVLEEVLVAVVDPHVCPIQLEDAEGDDSQEQVQRKASIRYHLLDNYRVLSNPQLVEEK